MRQVPRPPVERVLFRAGAFLERGVYVKVLAGVRAGSVGRVAGVAGERHAVVHFEDGQALPYSANDLVITYAPSTISAAAALAEAWS